MNLFNSIIPIAQAHEENDQFGHHMMMYDDYGLNLLGPTFMFFFWILIIAVIILVIKYLLDKNKDIQDSNNAENILKERYAKGEISKKEYIEKTKDIKK